MDKVSRKAKITSLLVVLSLVFSSNTQIAFSAGTPTPTNSPTPTFTPTPLTGLTLGNISYGCTSGPYITCSASAVVTHADPYRWDFDITYTYGDDVDWTGSNFTYSVQFYTGIYYVDVPIWWNIYPITNEVMPSRRIDIVYNGVSDLDPMPYPSGTWAVPGQPIPYNDFTVVFSRLTGASEILVRTDSWHLTVSTYPNIGTPTATPTITSTPTITLTPTITRTTTPTATLKPTKTFTPTTTATFTFTPTPTPYYLGSGYFPTNNLKRCHQGLGHAVEAQNASAQWSADTDLNISYKCTGTHITTQHDDFGNTGWAGYAYICSANNGCDNGSAFDDTFVSCVARLNEYSFANNPSFYTDAEVQIIAMHELGHCFSLSHSSDTTSIMGAGARGSVPNSQDIALINQRY